MSKWNNGVKLYAQELKDFLTDNNLEPTEQNMLNGAQSWKHYSYGGCSLIYDGDIADRLATPSEIRSCTRKDGSLKDANKTETWLDVQARALFQASQLILRETKQ